MTPDMETAAPGGHAEIILKSGAVITFECTELTWKRTPGISASLTWKQPPGAQRQPMHFDLGEIAAVVFVHDE